MKTWILPAIAAASLAATPALAQKPAPGHGAPVPGHSAAAPTPGPTPVIPISPPPISINQKIKWLQQDVTDLKAQVAALQAQLSTYPPAGALLTTGGASGAHCPGFGMMNPNDIIDRSNTSALRPAQDRYPDGTLMAMWFDCHK